MSFNPSTSDRMSMPRVLLRDLEIHDDDISETSSVKQDENMTFSLKNEIRNAEDFNEHVQLHNKIYSTRCHNYKQARIPLKSKLNIPLWRLELQDYKDFIICDFFRIWLAGRISVRRVWVPY